MSDNRCVDDFKAAPTQSLHIPKQTTFERPCTMGANQSRIRKRGENTSFHDAVAGESLDDVETAARSEDASNASMMGAGPARGRNGLTIALDGVGNEIKLGNGSSTKVILKSITGVISAGEMAAIMGPSGAGKTSLLDCISMRKTEGVMAGKILFDGVQPSLDTVKKYTAYVPQIEAFFGGATVYETILFAAMIKLPGTSAADVASKMERIEHVIDQMNLDKCRDTLVGSHIIRGISGGELKRLAVASSLCACNPRAMFLDEPTSGLDSTMAADVIKCLSRLQAEDGRTLLLTIHQPSMHVYQTFNKLILLSGGELTYFGNAGHHPMEFFATQGFTYEAGFNITEFLIDTVSQSSEACTSYYAKSSLCSENIKEVEEIALLKLPMNAVTINNEPGKDSPYAHGPLTELWIMIKFKDGPKWRYAVFWFTRCGLYMILAGLLSLFFYQQDRAPSGILNLNGIAFIACILPSFMAQVHTEEVKMEREVYTREFHDSFYRPGNYVASKIIAELPMTMLASIAFSAILYWCVGFNPSFSAFCFFVLTSFINFTIAQLIGCTISAAIPGEIGPASLLPIIATLNMLVGGFFIRAKTIHDMWKWLYTVSFIQWVWSALMVNEYQGRQFFDHCDSTTGGLDDLVDQLSLPESSVQLLRMFAANQNECDPITGESVLRTFSLESRNRWSSLLYASLSIPVYLFTFYLGVSRVRHEKR